MLKTLCKLCGKRHWVYEGHDLGIVGAEVEGEPQDGIARFYFGRGVKPPPTAYRAGIYGHGGRRAGAGRKGSGKSKAERQAAYRARRREHMKTLLLHGT